MLIYFKILGRDIANEIQWKRKNRKIASRTLKGQQPDNSSKYQIKNELCYSLSDSEFHQE